VMFSSSKIVEVI